MANTLDFQITCKFSWDSWFQTNFGDPTEVQTESWKAIQCGCNTLISAPTGTGKTMAAFFPLIKRLYKEKSIQESGSTREAAKNGQVRVLYISPLRALANDMGANLIKPLQDLARYHPNKENIKIGIRTGDTNSTQRQKLVRNPPEILITTPESFFLLLNSPKAKGMLSKIDTVIVDEIHALLGNKRGAHFFLGLERLCLEFAIEPQRIGISATLKPLKRVASYLIGMDALENNVKIIEASGRRKAKLSILVPKQPLQAITSHAAWESIYQKMANSVEKHESTIVFVNTRRLAEKVSFHLEELLGEDLVVCHHGSLSKEQRLDSEQKLKSGDAKVVVATASLELGIDIGSVSQVIQISSPRNISVFMQRLGRSGHGPYKTPECILVPLTRDELLDCISLCEAYKHQIMDAIIIQDRPLDILAQHIVAYSTSNQDRGVLEADCFSFVKKCYYFRELEKKQFEDTVEMLAKGYVEGRQQYAYITRDQLSGQIFPAKNASLTVLNSSGAIPETGEYRVISIADQSVVGSLNEEFAVESTSGDVFLLGNTAWRYLYLKGSDVYVESAHNIPPNVPFWQGEAPGRTDEISAILVDVRKQIAELVPEGSIQEYLKDKEIDIFEEVIPDFYQQAVKCMQELWPVDTYAAIQILHYIQVQRLAFGGIPDFQNIYFERCFDEAMGMQLIIHSPFGMRTNKAWGLALRKKFCRSFNFELQASADENGIVLSLGEQHSFPVEQLFELLTEANIKEVLVQAVLDSPMFQIRWRWNMNCSLAIPRVKAGKRVPPPIQRYRSDDLLSSAFPMATACLENIIGDIEVPNHPLVQQSLEDCIHHALNVTRLESVFMQKKQNKIKFHGIQTRKPSPFAYELLYSKAYTMIDDGEAEDRRAQKAKIEFNLKASEFIDLARIDSDLLEKTKKALLPELASPLDTLRLMQNILVLKKDVATMYGWTKAMAELLFTGRLVESTSRDGGSFYFLKEAINEIKMVYPQLTGLQEGEAIIEVENLSTEEHTTQKIILGNLIIFGPQSELELQDKSGLNQLQVKTALLTIEQRGRIVQGEFFEKSKVVWVERNLLKKLQNRTKKINRNRVKSFSPERYLEELSDLHGLHSPFKAIEAAVYHLEGYVAPVKIWIDDLFKSRVQQFDEQLLYQALALGKIRWWHIPPKEKKETYQLNQSSLVSFTLVDEDQHYNWFGPKVLQELKERCDKLSGDSLEVLRNLEVFPRTFNELQKNLDLKEARLAEILLELTAFGIIYFEKLEDIGFLGGMVKGTKVVAQKRAREANHSVNRKSKIRKSRMLSFSAPTTGKSLGRIHLFYNPFKDQKSLDWEVYLDSWVFLLLRRYGVVDPRCVQFEPLCPPWRVLVHKLRQLEMRGEILAGQFVDYDFPGEQFCHPEFYARLKKERGPDSRPLLLNTRDPLSRYSELKQASDKVVFNDGKFWAMLSKEREMTWLEEPKDLNYKIWLESTILSNAGKTLENSTPLYKKSRITKQKEISGINHDAKVKHHSSLEEQIAKWKLEQNSKKKKSMLRN